MPIEQFSDNASTTINQGGGIGAGDATVTVSSATGFPATSQYRIIIDSEEIIVTAGAGTTTWSITRGDNGTTPALHANGAVVTHVLTKPALLNAFAYKIDEVVLGGTAASIIFPNLVAAIPQTFRHLWIIWEARTDHAATIEDDIWIYFNTDATAGNYTLYQSYSNNGATSQGIVASNQSVGFLPGASGTASSFGHGTIMIANYTGANFKSAQGDSDTFSTLVTANTWVGKRYVQWNGTAALTNIKLAPSAAVNFIANSVFSLYGLP